MRTLDLDLLLNIDWTCEDIDVDALYEDKSVYDHFVYLYGDYVKEHHQAYIQYFRNELNYNYIQSCKLSRLRLLSELIRIDRPLQEAEDVPECPICNIHFKDMQAHIRKSHDIDDWEAFVNQFNYKYSPVYFSANHCERLSKNKIHFYNETEEGIKQRKEYLHFRYSGQNNPACRDDVRLKIAKARRASRGKGSAKLRQRHSEISSEVAKHNVNMMSFGYIFWTMIDGHEVRFRSKAEYLVKTMLDYYDISFLYEPDKIVYFDEDKGYERTYLPDFVIDGIFYEVKSSQSEFDLDSKYKYIQKSIALNMLAELKLVAPETFLDVLGIPESIQKTQSFFVDIVLDDIRRGRCKLIVPPHENRKYFTSGLSFLHKLGDNPEQIIAEGAKLYENKKCKNN